jgi:hypothetical protein
MGDLHEMLIEDEFVLCAITLLFGILVGGVARFVTRGQRRSA